MRLVPTLLATAVLQYSTNAIAEDDESGSAAGSFVDEVIVTAQKRSQVIQDIPAAITAIDSGTLDVNR